MAGSTPIPTPTPTLTLTLTLSLTLTQTLTLTLTLTGGFASGGVAVASATELGLLWGGGREDGERNALQQLLANYASDRALHTVQRASCMALRQAYRQV